MRRIKLSLFKSLFEKNLTGNEIDFILAISHYQNNAGVVCGMHYREMMAKTGMSAQAFYDCKKSLQEKGIIEASKGYRDYDIIMLDNDFSVYSEEDYENGKVPAYVSTDKRMFFDFNWKKLKPRQKLLAIDLFNINMAGQRAFRIGRKMFFEKYADGKWPDGSKRKGLLGITERTLQKYLKLLQLYFYIGLKDGIYYITLRRTFSKKEAKSSQEGTLGYLFKTSCRRNRIGSIDIDEKEKRDILNTFYIRRKSLMNGQAFSRVPGLFRRMLEILNEDIPNEQKWKRRLKASLFHKLLKKELGLELA